MWLCTNGSRYFAVHQFWAPLAIIMGDSNRNTVRYESIPWMLGSGGTGPGVHRHRGWLTDEVGQQEQQCYWDEDGTESSTFPVAVLVGLLQAEGRSREGVSGQRARGRRVHCAGGQRVSRWCRAIHWWCSTWFEQEVPGKTNKHFLASVYRNARFSGAIIAASQVIVCPRAVPSTGEWFCFQAYSILLP